MKAIKERFQELWPRNKVLIPILETCLKFLNSCSINTPNYILGFFFFFFVDCIGIADSVYFEHYFCHPPVITYISLIIHAIILINNIIHINSNWDVIYVRFYWSVATGKEKSLILNAKVFTIIQSSLDFLDAHV